MAAPHVTGVAALLKSANQNLTDEEIEKILEETAMPLKDATYYNSLNCGYGYGLVNAYDAVSKALGNGIGHIEGIVKDKDGKPLSANVYIEETDKMIATDKATGAYSLGHAEGPYTLFCSKEGYEAEKKHINIKKKGATQKIDFELTAKAKFDIDVTVTDSKNLPIPDANIKIMENDDIDIFKTNTSGKVTLKDQISGDLTLRVFKDGYKSVAREVHLDKSMAITLNMEAEESIEQELSYDHNKMNSLPEENFTIGSGGFVGGDVQFITAKKQAIVKDVSVQFIENAYMRPGREAALSIKTMDSQGRVTEKMKPLKFEFNYGECKRINLEKYQIEVNVPYFVVLQPASSNSSAYAIGADRTGDVNHFFIFASNNFYPVQTEFYDGALMIRSTLTYPKGVEDLAINVQKPKLDKVLPNVRKITGKTELIKMFKLLSKNKND